MSWSERRWWLFHGKEIVNTMAAPSGPDVVGLLHDDTTYSVYGDHGGAAEEVQRVPMVFWQQGVRGSSSVLPFRTPDVLPTILRAMEIPLTHPVDGRGWPLSSFHW
jgi:arylsulfatase A-like enzyme